MNPDDALRRCDAEIARCERHIRAGDAGYDGGRWELWLLGYADWCAERRMILAEQGTGTW